LLVIEAKIMDCDDIRMGEVSCGFGFLPEALAEGRVLRKIFAQQLDRYGALEHQIASTIYLCHAARADASFNLIAVIQQARTAHIADNSSTNMEDRKNSGKMIG
jgi:hypothetical protein